MYVEKANNRGGGVGTETQIITPGVYTNTKQEKFIPIALEKKDDDYLLPNYFKSTFALGITNLDNIDDDEFEDVKKMIWGHYVLQPPKRGGIPSFVSKHGEASEKQNDTDEVLIDQDDQERVLWLLSRGFLSMRNITYQSSSSWSVVVSYYRYDGEWIHDTHYHDSYSRTWDDDLDIQFRKLGIPKADWLYGRAPLRFLQELREVEEKIDIRSKVEEERADDYYSVYYYAPNEAIKLPKVPEKYLFEFKSGNIRDLIVKLASKKGEWDTTAEFIEKARSMRQDVHIESLRFLGKDNPSFDFIKEILDEYRSDFSLSEVYQWSERLSSILSNTLKHERQK